MATRESSDDAEASVGVDWLAEVSGERLRNFVAAEVVGFAMLTGAEEDMSMVMERRRSWW